MAGHTEAFLRLSTDAMFDLVQANHSLPARTFARGLRRQSRGGQIAAVAELVRALAKQDPGIAADIAADLNRAGRVA